MSRVVEENHSVIFRLSSGDRLTSTKVKANCQVKLGGRKRYSLSTFIGQPYGAVFELSKPVAGDTRQKPTFVRVDGGLELDNDDPSLTESDSIPHGNNDAFHDSNTAQALSAREIEELKENVSGKEIVEKLAASSSTFSTKTEMSRDKYMSRKRKKYMLRVQIGHPTAPAISESYFAKKSEAVNGLRPDTLAQLLASANVHAESRSLVVDTLQGLVVGAVAERQGCTGSIMVGHHKGSPNLSAVEYFNFPVGIRHRITPFRLHLLGPAARHLAENPVVATNTSETKANEGVDEPMPDAENSAPLASCSTSNPANEGASEPGSIKAQRERQYNLVEPSVAVDMLCQRFDSLIIACEFDPFEILKACWPFLVPSGAFVIYSRSLEPLSHCLSKMKAESFQFCNPVLTDSWLREYQVLPYRTHPMMAMSATGGFLLTAFKVMDPLFPRGDDSIVDTEVPQSEDASNPPAKKIKPNS